MFGAKIGVLGSRAARVARGKTAQGTRRLKDSHAWIQEIPPDMLLVRHVQRLVAGFLTMGCDEESVTLAGSSAGTRSAVALAVHAASESAKYIAWGTPEWRPAALLLVSLGAPSTYLRALAKMPISVRIVHAGGDRLCPIHMDSLKRVVEDAGGWSLLELKVPMVAMTGLVLGPSAHGYTHYTPLAMSRSDGRGKANREQSHWTYRGCSSALSQQGP